MRLLMRRQHFSKHVKLTAIVIIIAIQSLSVIPATAQSGSQSTQETLAIAKEADDGSLLSGEATKRAEQIELRLTSLLETTNFFTDISVRYVDGVVFLDGIARDQISRSQAVELVQNVDGVAAVINRLKVAEVPIFDVTPIVGEIKLIWKDTLRHLPRICLAFIIILIAVIVARQVRNLIQKVFLSRYNPLVRSVITRIVSVLLIIVGLYFALVIAGFGELSKTILGGTGLAGLVAGIAFKDLLENYLASILISIRNPFKLGDIVEIQEHLRIVEKVTTRGTVLMNQDGNHIQTPNAMVYKSIIKNLTANPNRRDCFEVGIGYDCNITKAQEIALRATTSHPGVLQDPETLVLADRLGAAAVVMKIYFWYDCSKHIGIKLKSALIRMVKQQFEQHQISMPDEARERVFPQGVTVQIAEADDWQHHEKADLPAKEKDVSASVEGFSNNAEGTSGSEEDILLKQARNSRVPEEGESIVEGRQQAEV